MLHQNANFEKAVEKQRFPEAIANKTDPQKQQPSANFMKIWAYTLVYAHAPAI